ncbi:MAG: ABC transporter substrate-binding protein [Candidatus Latescibacterota bacterium]|nr:MAG: ABC transporter substrate-binding protein [Candidatus Latescibacterota bacterium]
MSCFRSQLLRGGLFALALPAFLAVSCGRERGADRLRLSFQTEPSTFDPAFSVDVSSGTVSSLVHATLVAFDADARIVPGLARRWEAGDGAREYRFHLGADRFANGRRVTAEDVVYSFRRLLDPATASPRWWLLRPLRGAAAFHAGGPWSGETASAPDDSTVVIRLEDPVPHLLGLLAMPSAGIVCREEVERLGPLYGREPCGSGPWRLVSWREGDEIVLEPNPGWGGARPGVAGLSFRVIPEQMTQIAEFEVGSLDLIEVPRAELEHWRAAGAELLSREELRVVYIGLNTRRPPLDDPRVRRALNHAVDVEKIIAQVLFGAGRRARGAVPPGLRAWEECAERYPYDPEAARRLLAEAGRGDGFRLEIWQRENPEAGRILEAVQGYLSRVGIEARLVTREWSAFKEAIDRGVPDAFYIDWIADYPDAENFLAPLFHSANAGGGGNRTGYRNERVDSLLDAAATLMDGDRRREHQRAAEEIVYGDAPWIFLWFPERYEMTSPRMSGYEMPLIFNGQRFLDVRLR